MTPTPVQAARAAAFAGFKEADTHRDDDTGSCAALAASEHRMIGGKAGGKLNHDGGGQRVNGARGVRTAIWVISLANDRDRRETFIRNAAAADVAWSFVDACPGLAPGLDYDPADSMVTVGRPLVAGELGCYASHFSLWEKLIQSEYDQLIVMEDDLLVDWAFVRLLLDVDFAARGIHYLRLFSRLMAPFKRLRWEYLEKSHHLIRFVGYALGCQAYVITRDGATTFLRHCRRVRLPLDHEMDRFWAHGLPNLAVYPYPFIELCSPSRIGDARHEADAVPLKFRAQGFLTRAADKACLAWARFSPNPAIVYD
jgi:glycosyl transferase, family 25